MAEQHSTEGASTSGASVPAADSTVELNIKTLDSQIHSFRVDRDVLVSSFKGKIADQVGVPVGQQRLIFRGKVLKDEHMLSEYHVENGDTLHLVERQLTQPQTSSGSGSGSVDASGMDTGSGAPRNRIGQISHSVVLGTVNLGDQGEGGAPDFGRVIGAVLNSLGVGNLTTNAAFGAPNTAAATASGPLPEGSDTEQARSDNGSQSQTGNQTQFGQPFLSQPYHVPLAGISIPPPSLNTPIPDSLNTLFEFMNRMEGVLLPNASSSPSGTSNQSVPELPSNAHGVHTPEALSIVLRHAQRLLSGPTVAALSQLAGRIEQEAGSTDASVRSQIQSESVQVGLAMQHIGALLLELGRTILMLRMGQSPAEAVVNAGHAVYISPSGPNPIMVQPFPHQTSPLFNPPAVSAPTGNSVPVGIIGGAPRNINIHIHAGTSLSPIVSAVGARAAGGEGTQGEHTSTASGESGATRVLPVRNVIATAVPSRTATIAVSPILSTSQPMGNVSTSASPDAAALSTAISQVNSRIRNFLENMRTDTLTPSGQQENLVVPSSSAGSGGEATTEVVDPSKCIDSEGHEGVRGLQIGSAPGHLSQEDPSHPTERLVNVHSASSQTNAESLSPLEQSSSVVGGELAEKSAGAKDAPLGLGGGLQPKRRSRQSKMQPVNGEAGPSSNLEQSQQARVVGQQILQSLASRSSLGESHVADHGGGQAQLEIGQLQQGLNPPLLSSQAGAQGSDQQVDLTGMMSQLLESPAINGLLSGVARQTGVGSPNVLRNMLQQFTQNPAMRNTVNQLVQQVDREEFSNMFSGVGAGEGGTLDFSTMIQQMMPVVSQVLGSNSVQNDHPQNMVPELLSQVGQRSLEDSSYVSVSQDNIQEVVHRIALHSPSQDIFRAMVQNAAGHVEATEGELVDGLSNNQDLIDQFGDMLRNDLQSRLSGD